jgi:hypothetical protein
MDFVQQRHPSIPLRIACAALGVPRATLYRRLRPRPCRYTHAAASITSSPQ